MLGTFRIQLVFSTLCENKKRFTNFKQNIMKNLLFLILFLPLVVIAQVEVTKDYAGMISGASYQLDSAETPSFTNVRVGAEAVWAVNPKFEIKSFGVYQTPNTFIHSFFGVYRPDSSWIIEAGKIATLMGHHRPHPVSSGSHFEPWSLRQIPGGGLGGAVRFIPNSSTEIAIGSYLRDSVFEAQTKLKFNSFILGGYYQPETNISGGAITFEKGRVTTTTAFQNDKLVANLFLLTLGRNKDFMFFSDMGFGLDTESVEEILIRGEWGLLKSFELEKFEGLYSLSYTYETNSMNSYLFVHF